jgi:mono/diheme cytochrome c family protein
MTTWTGALRALPLALVAALALGYGGATVANGAAPKAGPFTAAQAATGAKAYAENCSRCHGANLQGVSAPALKGAASGIKGDTVADAYNFLSVQMPAGAPGSLSDADYVSIMAFILSKDGVHPGSVKLTAAIAKKYKAITL